MAVHNSGGKVIAQVESLTDNGKINPKNVVVPGYLIDYLVLSKDSKSDHRQSCKYVYEPSLAGNYSKKQSKISVNDPTNKIERQIIAKRAIEELNDGDIINLGQGIPTDIIPLLQNNTNLKNVNYS